MRILFAFNDSVSEPEPLVGMGNTSNGKSGTRGTFSNSINVLPDDVAESSNDRLYSTTGHLGHVGPRIKESTVDSLNVQSDNQDLALVAERFNQGDIVDRILDFPDNPYVDFKEPEYKCAQCERCIHFDFLASPISQSCMIGAAQPYKLHTKTTFLNIVAHCVRWQSATHCSGTTKLEKWDEDLDYPF